MGYIIAGAGSCRINHLYAREKNKSGMTCWSLQWRFQELEVTFLTYDQYKVSTRIDGPFFDEVRKGIFS